MLKKLLMLVFVLSLISACASTQDEEYSDEYDAIESEEDAQNLNKEGEEVSVSDRVYFGLNQYNISSESADVLNLQADWLKSDDQITIVVEGHCDERGTREYNLALGERRANAVKQYLIRQGIDANRIRTISYGKERPVVLGTGEAVWAKNRVAITVQAQ